MPRPTFLTMTPLPDLNTLVEVSFHPAETPHDPGWDGSLSQPHGWGWQRGCPRAQRLYLGAPGTRGSPAGAVEAPALDSQLSAAAMLPITGGASLQHESGISSSPCSAPSPVK